MVGIRLYHGTSIEFAENIRDNGVLLSAGKPGHDFGQGFYTTPKLEFAQETALARMKANLLPSDSGKSDGYAVVVFSIDDSALEKLNFKWFAKPTDEWARFVMANRVNSDEVRKEVLHNRDCRFDLVIGPTADGKKGTLTVLSNKISRDLVQLCDITISDVFPSNRENWGLQWSFHTPKSLTCLFFENVLYY